MAGFLFMEIKMAETVTVGCKLAHGIHMDLHPKGQPRKRFTLKGNNSARVIGGFGITENVPKDHFDEWLRIHKNLPAVVDGLIFAMSQTASVEAKAREMAELRHGAERINPEDPLSDSRLGLKKPQKGEDPIIEVMKGV